MLVKGAPDDVIQMTGKISKKSIVSINWTACDATTELQGLVWSINMVMGKFFKQFYMNNTFVDLLAHAV